MKFNFEVNPTGLPFDDAVEQFVSEADKRDEERVEVKVKGDSEVLIQANHEGWLYLAKICVEMAYAAKEDPTYHQHRKSDFSVSMKDGEEGISLFSFGK